jgi:beta-carotene ketolase (CrtW type)
LIPTTGLGLALLLLVGWGVSGLSLLNSSLAQWPLWLVVSAVALRTLLQTGLFIIGHDAMHGVLLPKHPRSNHAVGACALGLYAGLAYGACRQKHQRHHRCTASSSDPDFHPDPAAGPVRWYLRFMAGYLSPWQMGRLLGGWGLLALLFSPSNPSSWVNLLLFCTVPLLLSSLQLFLFGTYLPHRRQRSGRSGMTPDSLDWPAWLSLLACFHFGYHREHHDHPELAWFELPRLRRRSRGLARV